MIAPKHDRRYLQRNLPLYFAYSFLMNFALWGGIWIKYLLDERGMQLKWILLMDLPFWLIVAAAQAPTGALADHIGRKRVMAIGSLLFSITILGFGFTTNYWILFAVYIVWGFAQAMQTGADSAMLYDSLKAAGEERKYQRYAGRGFATVLTAGMVSVVLGGLAAEVTSLSFIVKVSALTPLLAMIVCFFLKEPPVAVRKDRHYLRDMRASFDFAWHNKPIRYSVLMFSVLLTGTFGPVVLIQPFLLDHDIPTGLYGFFQAPLRLTAVVAALLAFRISTRLGPSRVLVGACSAIVLSYAGLAAIDTTAAFAFFALPGFIQGIMRPVIDGYINERTPSERRATVLSLAQLCFALQVAWFEPLLGFLTDDVSLTAAFFVSAVYFGVMMPPMVYLWRRAHLEGERVAALRLAPAVGAPGSG